MTRRAFIIRPFGRKRIQTDVGTPEAEVDFDRVERELIGPALEALDIGGRTTGEIFSQGNIREDMFHRLMTADLVVADISIPNANVFYELGIRHALQDRHTVLIRFVVPDQKAVFDIAPERYMVYDVDNPSSNAAELIRRLRSTLHEDRADSPVFAFLPDLQPRRRVDFIKVPREFVEDVENARERGMDGELDAYADELIALDIPWGTRGLIEIAEAQYRRRTWETACRTWETIRESAPLDTQANRRLATIYQKRSKPDLRASDQALERALQNSLSEYDRAELSALKGSNVKTRWVEDFHLEPELEGRKQRALASVHLSSARATYRDAFYACLNHYYSGVNALALTTLQCELAREQPQTWNDSHPSDAIAARALQELQDERTRLDAALRVSLQAASDPWARIARADHRCLQEPDPRRVKQQYAQALSDVDQQTLGTVRRQLALYLSLGFVEDNARAALESVDERIGAPEVTPRMVVVFSGHRIDPADIEAGTQARFPQRAEPRAREMIRQRLFELQHEASGELVGYAGGASGGDILFHEVCDELGIPTTLLLAGPVASFCAASVQDGGPHWVRRYEELVRKRADATLQLTRDLQLPHWLRDVLGFNIWQHNNLWTLHTALAHGGDRVVLLALWNYGPGRDTGGTEHMVAEVRRRGGRVEVLDARELLD